VEDGRLEVSAVSNAGVCSVMSFFPAGELRRMMDDGGRRCSVQRMVLGTHFILPGWCMMGNRGTVLVIQWRVAPFDCRLARSPNGCYGSPLCDGGRYFLRRGGDEARGCGGREAHTISDGGVSR
jgi:hypothetical protein